MNTKFKYKFTPWFIVCFVAGLLLATGCIVMNIVRFVQLLNSGKAIAYNYISTIIPIVIGILAFVFILPAMFSSFYTVDEKNLVSRWGIIKSQFEVKTIVMVKHFRKTNKLAIYFEDQSYLNICIDQSQFDEFIDTLKGVNKKILYDCDSES